MSCYDEGARVRVVRFGNRMAPGTVVADNGRSRVRVKLDTGIVQNFERERVSPLTRPSNHFQVVPQQTAASSLGATLRAVPKPPKPARSRSYLDFIRAMACCICSAPPPSDPHHWGERGMGQKATDFSAVPLCRVHHDQWHDHRRFTHGGRRWSVDEGVTHLLRVQVTCLQEWLEGRR